MHAENNAFLFTSLAMKNLLKILCAAALAGLYPPVAAENSVFGAQFEATPSAQNNIRTGICL
jgi:hypothetical protein